jgi:hypothetical protein
VIFIRGWSPVAGAPQGVSKLELHQPPLQTALKLEEYRGRYLDNDGKPGLVLDASGTSPTKVQRDELLESWAASSGPGRRQARHDLGRRQGRQVSSRRTCATRRRPS